MIVSNVSQRQDHLDQLNDFNLSELMNSLDTRGQIYKTVFREEILNYVDRTYDNVNLKRYIDHLEGTMAGEDLSEWCLDYDCELSDDPSDLYLDSPYPWVILKKNVYGDYKASIIQNEEEDKALNEGGVFRQWPMDIARRIVSGEFYVSLSGAEKFELMKATTS